MFCSQMPKEASTKSKVRWIARCSSFSLLLTCRILSCIVFALTFVMNVQLHKPKSITLTHMHFYHYINVYNGTLYLLCT